MLAIGLWCATVVACGGGAGGNATSATVLQLHGTAATGAAIAHAEVRLRCNGVGRIVSASARTDGDGAYRATVADAAFPCLLQVTDSRGTAWHSYANAQGSAHITPLTDATLSGALAQDDLAAVFSQFGSAQLQALQSALAQDRPAQAWAALRVRLQALGVDVDAVAHSPFTDPLQADAAHAHTGHDKLLDDTARYQGTALRHMAAGLPAAPVRATGRLNDTGIDWCSENTSTPGTWVNGALCSALRWVDALWGPEQDAYFGRDAQARAGTLKKVGAGMAGFDFTRLGATGQALAVQDATWSALGTEADGTRWDCVRDNVTGLWWEVKRADSGDLRAMQHSYTWYDPDSRANGGDAGTPASNTCAGLGDSTQCNTHRYVQAVNAAGLCGKNDWRMPTVDELRNLVHAGRGSPTLDTDHFPNTAGEGYWTGSPYAVSANSAWSVHFYYGNDLWEEKNQARRVRLVRSDP